MLSPLLRVLLAQVGQLKQGMRFLEGSYGNALWRLGRRGFVDLTLIDSLQKTVRVHLLADLDAAGLLTATDVSEVERVERWGLAFLERSAVNMVSEDHLAVVRYFRWSLIRKDRARESRSLKPLTRFRRRTYQLRQIVAFCVELRKRGYAIATCSTEHLIPAPSKGVCSFLRWARSQRLTAVRLPDRPYAAPYKGYGSKQRADMMAKLLSDDSVALRSRVMGLLVFIGFDLSQLSSIKIADLILDDVTCIRIGREKYGIREDVAAILRRYLSSSKLGPTSWKNYGESRWLFPGRFQGRPMSRATAIARLRAIGIGTALARNSFLLAISQNLIWLVVTLKALNRSLSSVANWRRAGNGKYASYFGNAFKFGVRRHRLSAQV